MKRFLPGLLSRSCALAAASLALGASLFSVPAAALQVSLGSGCSGTGPWPYATITVSGSGNVTVDCTASGPGTFALTAPGSININAASTATTVTRSGGSAGSVTVTYSAGGACTSPATTVVFADSDTTAKSITLNTGGGTGTCAVSLSSVSGGTIGSPSSANIPVVNNSAPGTFALSAPSGLATSITTTNQIVVNRAGGSAGASTINYTATGACSSAGSSVSFADGSATAQPIVVSTGASSGTCTVTLTSVSGAGALGSPTVASIALSAPPAGCPAPPDNMIETGAFRGMGNPIVPGGGDIFLPVTPGTVSGQVISFPLPAVGAIAPRSTGVITIGETSSASSPNPVVIEMSISKCKGIISSDTSTVCNQRANNGNYNNITWVGKAFSVVSGPATANAYGWCWAPSSEGQWYLNARWIHNGCAAGAPTCGFSFQYGFGPY